MLARLCTGPVIDKTRNRVAYRGKIWEVDVFVGTASGLVLAEIELSRPDERVDLPDWIGAEVTDDPAFRSSAIAVMQEMAVAG